MRVLVMGCSQQSHHLLSVLLEEGHKVTVLMDNPSCQQHLTRDLPVNLLFSTGSLMEDLQRGNIDDVDTFLALSTNDVRNAMAAQIAIHIFSVSKVLCHVGDYSRYDAYKAMGLDVVSSTATVSNAIIHSLAKEA